MANEPAVKASVPISIEPNVSVMEPAVSAPTVVIAPTPEEVKYFASASDFV